uniref:DUF3987 domain-containing protein n=1 Tax=Dictyoglomus turgidum TaxID=513050 RepID=A0A7C3SS27_9BACT
MSEQNYQKIDTSKFKQISLQELNEILGLTIKKDEVNKSITFLCALSAYTENSQFNISFNAPSSSGKSYIPLEIAQLFPKEDVIKTGYASPTAFFHEHGEFKKELKGYEVDLERKILIFLDQPHNLLLQHLRPLLSHDEKEILLKITDKNERYGLKTKNILIKGFPSVIFCSAGLKIDEQEATRMILLSPEITQEKIREGIYTKIQKEADEIAFKNWLEENPKRKLLKERISAIKQENIKEIKISSPELLKEMFEKRIKILKPRHQRDIGRIISLAKSLALLNLWWRERTQQTIIANSEDIREAFKLWDEISESQELGIPPYIYNLYKNIILPLWEEKNSEGDGGIVEPNGIEREEIIKKHFQVYGQPLDPLKLRQQIIPMWESAGLIYQKPDPNDRRKMLIYPTTPLTIFKKQNNSELGGGVNEVKE